MISGLGKPLYRIAPELSRSAMRNRCELQNAGLAYAEKSGEDAY